MLFVFLVSITFSQSYSIRYINKEIIKENCIDTCDIYTVNNDSSISLAETVIYDSLGNEIKYIMPKLQITYKYIYDKRGLKVCEFLFHDDGIKIYSIVDTFIYDFKQNLRKKITINNWMPLSKIGDKDYVAIKNDTTQIEYKYQKKNKITMVDKYLNGTFYEKNLYKYNRNDNLIQFNVISAKGDTTINYIYNYNEKNQVISFSCYDKNFKLIQLYKKTYDKSGLTLYWESYTDIIDEDIKQSNYHKAIYKYR